MQFREVGQRVHCLVARYDPESKRTRQTLIYSFLAAAPRKPSELDLRGDHGTPEQRQKWARAICMEIFQRSITQGTADPTSLASKLNEVGMAVLMQFQVKPFPFSKESMEGMRHTIKLLVRFMELDFEEENEQAKTKGKKNEF